MLTQTIHLMNSLKNYLIKFAHKTNALQELFSAVSFIIVFKSSNIDPLSILIS